MYLCDREIQEYLDKGLLVLYSTVPDFPFRDLTYKRNRNEESQIQPASIDLRVGNIFYRFKKDVKLIDVAEYVNVPGLKSSATKTMESLVERFTVSPTQSVEIPAHGWVGGQTLEYMKIPDGIAGKIEGRSRIARMGLSIHCTGDFINPLFEGVMPLQLINHNSFPVRIYAYMSIGQLMLVRLTGFPEQKYPSLNPPYQGQDVPPMTDLEGDPALIQRKIENNETDEDVSDNSSSDLDTRPSIAQASVEAPIFSKNLSEDTSKSGSDSTDTDVT